MQKLQTKWQTVHSLTHSTTNKVWVTFKKDWNYGFLLLILFFCFVLLWVFPMSKATRSNNRISAKTVISKSSEVHTWCDAKEIVLVETSFYRGTQCTQKVIFHNGFHVFYDFQIEQILFHSVCISNRHLLLLNESSCESMLYLFWQISLYSVCRDIFSFCLLIWAFSPFHLEKKDLLILKVSLHTSLVIFSLQL